MNLNHENLKNIIRLTNQQIADPTHLTPRVIQFGTGVLLRGLPDYYIDKANRLGAFDGSIILIKSTDQGDTTSFENQDNYYSIQTEGIENGNTIQERQIVTCIAQILTTKNDWERIITLAEDPNIKFIISNTTESGIVEVDENLNEIPSSYPGRLTALLYRRYQYFNANPDKGFIILPTELIDNNANKLKEIVLSIARKNKLSPNFIQWIEEANYFCNTLVDRIVPGRIDSSDWEYQDDLAIAVEPFNLWAIEIKKPQIKDKIPFAKVNPGIKLIDSIEHIKELKLRLLNATHTLTCPIAILANQRLVKETLNEKPLETWVQGITNKELKHHLILSGIKESDIIDFSSTIIDRFKNPFIDHKWLSIAQNSTQKWRQRVIPILESWQNTQNEPSTHIALSMACYLKCHERYSPIEFPIDIQIKEAIEKHKSISDILNNKDIWHSDLSKNKSFTTLVEKYYQELDSKSIYQIIIN